MLLELSNGQDLEFATRAVESLVKIDPRVAASRIPSLLLWVSPDHEHAIRLRAMATLRDLGPAAITAVPSLLPLANEDDMAIRAAAIEAVSKIDPRDRGKALKHNSNRHASVRTGSR